MWQPEQPGSGLAPIKKPFDLAPNRSSTPNHLGAETAAPKSRGPLDGIKLRLFRVEAYDQAVNTPRSNAYPIIYSLLTASFRYIICNHYPHSTPISS